MVIFGGSYFIISYVGTDGTKEPLSESAAKSTYLVFDWIKSVIFCLCFRLYIEIDCPSLIVRLFLFSLNQFQN